MGIVSYRLDDCFKGAVTERSEEVRSPQVLLSTGYNNNAADSATVSASCSYDCQHNCPYNCPYNCPHNCPYDRSCPREYN